MLVSTKAARLKINQCGDLSLPVSTPSCSVWIMATVYSILYFTFKIKKKKQQQHRKDGQIDQQDESEFTSGTGLREGTLIKGELTRLATECCQDWPTMATSHSRDSEHCGCSAQELDVSAVASWHYMPGVSLESFSSRPCGKLKRPGSDLSGRRPR